VISTAVDSSPARSAPPLPLSLRILPSADLPFVRATWAEGYKHSPRNTKLPWRVYKRQEIPEIDAILDRDDTQIIAAYLGSAVAGWLAFSKQWSIPAVHWVYTRASLERGAPDTLRRRGIMTALLGAAQLGSRIVYTHKGPRGRGSPVTSDEWIVPWLAKRGVAAAFVSREEWIR
jgi:hypothetical protein